MRDTKEREKEYLRRMGSSDWDYYKPFAPPGLDNTAESTELIQDFAVVLRALAPSPSDLILDLGAGACWCTDWLRRLNLRVVSVDLALDMLRVGQSRLGSGGRLVAGDMEHLPFASASFDRACCLNALHHVPSIPTALAEICRVLVPGGKAVFVEPGIGHAASPDAVAAMRDLGVLEQDIVIESFLQQCDEAGFESAHLLPMSRILSDVVLSGDQWSSLTRFARRKRPRRALEKAWRALLEAAGIGWKNGLLFEERFAVDAVLRLKGDLDTRPVVIVSRPGGAPTLLEHDGYSCSIRIVGGATSPVERDSIPIQLEIKNLGTRSWTADASSQTPCVRIGVQLLDGSGALVDRDYFRQGLPDDVESGRTVIASFSVPTPPKDASYSIKIDLVAEGLTWFESRGSKPLIVPLRVERRGNQHTRELRREP